MTLSQLKETLLQLEELTFLLPNGEKVPAHFHVTEVGEITKNFIDCGGTVRKETTVGLQLWSSVDTNHRLQASKLLSIIGLSEEKLGIADNEIEVEYQGTTIEKHGLEFSTGSLQLTQTKTQCLAENSCGISMPKIKVSMANLSSQNDGATCTPGSGCC